LRCRDSSYNSPMLSGVALNEELAVRYKRWLVAQRYAEESRNIYCRIVGYFTRFMGRKPVTQSTHLDIREYLAARAATKPPSTNLRNELYALRVYFDFLNMGGLVHSSLPRFIRIRRGPRRVPPVLTEEQVRRLLRATKDVRERALIELLYASGCRNGEVRTMRVEDLDWNARRVRVVGKRGPRWVIFGKPAARALRQYVGSRRTGFLFIDARGQQEVKAYSVNGCAGWHYRWKKFDRTGRTIGIGNANISAARRLSRARALAELRRIVPVDELKRPLGLKPICGDAVRNTVRKIGLRVGISATPLMLRHSFATHLLDHGANIRVIQELMGHARLNSTEVYTHVSKSHLTSTFNRCHPRAADR
jgi:site-specific recombinase XerD